MKPILMREVLGELLREQRLGSDRTLRDVSTCARVSLGYLSEIERGQKEASSELLASISEALGIPMSKLFLMTGRRMAQHEREQRLHTAA